MILLHIFFNILELMVVYYIIHFVSLLIFQITQNALLSLCTNLILAVFYTLGEIVFFHVGHIKLTLFWVGIAFSTLFLKRFLVKQS